MPRLFTALEITPDVVLALSLLRGGLPQARWIEAEDYHLTLRFIGDVESRLADEIAIGLDAVHRAPFEITLRGLGAFGSKKPHSLYAAVAPSPPLEVLRADIDRVCRRLGLPADPRKFTPHVTLARLRQPKSEEVARYLTGRGDFNSRPIRVTRFGLFTARDSVGGGPYVLEEAYGLNGKTIGAGSGEAEARRAGATR